jgi:hypothetical protein
MTRETEDVAAFRKELTELRSEAKPIYGENI